MTAEGGAGHTGPGVRAMGWGREMGDVAAEEQRGETGDVGLKGCSP